MVAYTAGNLGGFEGGADSLVDSHSQDWGDPSISSYMCSNRDHTSFTVVQENHLLHSLAQQAPLEELGTYQLDALLPNKSRKPSPFTYYLQPFDEQEKLDSRFVVQGKKYLPHYHA